MGCVFCEVISGAAEAAIVHRDEAAVVFLDKSPLFPGHCLIAPVEHHETLPDLPPSLVAPLFGTVRRVAAALEGGFGAQGSFVAMNNRISQSVPHLHVHVVPRRRKDGLRGFFWPRTRYAGGLEEMRGVARSIAEALDAVPG